MKNIIVITSWSINDGLIQSYTLPYLRIIRKYLPEGSTITLVTLEKEDLSDNLILIEENIQNIQLKYTPFSFKATLAWMRNLFVLNKFIRKNKIDKIHVWCTPSGMVGYILSMMTSRKLIIDSYEPHAEAMVENGEWKKNSIAFRILFEFERLQTKRAQFIIATTNGMIGYARQKYGYRGNNFFVKPACVDLERFSLNRTKNSGLVEKYELNDKIIGLYCGKFGGIYFKEEVFDLFKEGFDFWGEKFKVLILTSHQENEIYDLALNAGIERKNIIVKFVNHNEIPDYIGLADFAVTPVKPVPTKRFCTPVKDGEYWALGLPVIISKNISDDSELIDKYDAGYVLQDYKISEYKNAIMKIDSMLKQNQPKNSHKIRNIAMEYRNFELANELYKKIYGDLFL